MPSVTLWPMPEPAGSPPVSTQLDAARPDAARPGPAPDGADGASPSARLTPAVEPPPCGWVFPPPSSADEHGLVGLGADLEPGTILAAYANGLFPMPLRKRGPIGWWSPDPRAILELDDLRVCRSLRQSARKFEVRIDWDFAGVIDGCADPRRDKGWIDRRMRDAYLRLHHLGWVHSVETYDADGALVGGLYGVAIGGFFAGESMFHRARDASKVALVALVELLKAEGATLLDVQWLTPHLARLGAREISRDRYLARLGEALARPAPPAWCRTPARGLSL